MGLILNPYRFAAAGGGAITIGNTVARTGNLATGANNQIGVAWQATQSGTVNFITIVGHGSSATSVNYRLCIYAATSLTAWGALLGQTADQNGLGIAEVKKVALQAPVSIVAGNWYAITVQTAASMPAGSSNGGQDRFFADTYSDGAAATAGATDLFSTGAHCIYASTL